MTPSTLSKFVLVGLGASALTWTLATGRLPLAGATCSSLAQQEFAASVDKLNQGLAAIYRSPSDANLMALGIGGITAAMMISTQAGLQVAPLAINATNAGEHDGQIICRATARARISYMARVAPGNGSDAFRPRVFDADLNYGFAYVPGQDDAITETILPASILEQIIVNANDPHGSRANSAAAPEAARTIPALSDSQAGALSNTSLLLLILSIFAVILSVASGWVAHRKRRSAFFWAVFGWVLSYLGLLAILMTDEAPRQLPRKLRIAHARAKATGRADAFPSALGALDERKWQAIVASRPTLNDAARRIEAKHGPYFAQLFAVVCLTFNGAWDDKQVEAWVEAEASQVEARRAERQAVLGDLENQNASATFSALLEKVRGIYVTANGVAAELKDRTAIVEVDGKLVRFLSVPTYQDTYNDHDIWAPVAADQDRRFAIAKIAASGAVNTRAINRTEGSV